MNSTIHASGRTDRAEGGAIAGRRAVATSQLVWDLLQGALPFTRLVADDRAHVEACAGRLLVWPARSSTDDRNPRRGIRRLPFEPWRQSASWLILAAEDAVRFPDPQAVQAS